MVDDEDDSGLRDENEDVSLATPLADTASLFEELIPEDLRARYEFHSYKNAVVVLAKTCPDEWAELLGALRNFTITTRILQKPGGNETDIPKQFSYLLRPSKWHETIIRGDLHVRLTWRDVVRHTRKGNPVTGVVHRDLARKGYLDGHKIDYVKNRVAFDLEWNSKDQTFDRDLYAFSAFYQAGAIDAGVLLTRSAELNDVFKALPSLDKAGNEVPGTTIMGKYGASTTWMGKLLYRLNAGRNGGCPVLAIGIRPGCISNWPLAEA